MCRLWVRVLTIWPSHKQNEEGCTDKDIPWVETPTSVARKVKPEDLTIVEPIMDRERAELVAKMEL